MSGWTINCKEYAQFVSQGMDQPLSLWRRMSLKFHGIICPPCESLRRQFVTMRDACRFMPENPSVKDRKSIQLSDDTCQRLKEAIKKAVEEK